MAMADPRRPVLRYHGGKWKLAPWVISHFPPHRTYVEPFGGAASVLIRKPRAYGEVYNDMDGEVVNVFRVLQDAAKAELLRRRLTLTPFARAEFEDAYLEPTDDVDAAAKMITRAYMGFGSASMTRMHITGFRSNCNRAGTTPAQDWSTWPDNVPHFCDRLRGVVIENRDGIAVMAQHDSPGTLHYVDPPYVQSTRSSLKHRNGNRGHYYRHELDDDGHRRLAEFLHGCAGMVALSGYPSDLYRELYSDWTVMSIEHMADGARPRLEMLWLNPAAVSKQRQVGLF